MVISILNQSTIEQHCTLDLNSFMILLVGDSFNNILVYERYRFVFTSNVMFYIIHFLPFCSHDYLLQNCEIQKVVTVQHQEKNEVKAYFISDEWGEYLFCIL